MAHDNLEKNIYLSIKEILTSAREKAYKAVNFAMVEAYWNVGKLIVEAQAGNERAEYGEELLKNLSKELTREFGKGFTVTNLRYMRQFYMVFQKHHALRDELSWTHYRLLMKIENEEIRNFYIDECIGGNWSTRQLERQINTFYYQRILASQNKPLVRNEINRLERDFQAEDIIKDPFVLEFMGHQDIGQMDFYVRYFEKEIKSDSDNPTIGIILSSERNETVVKYSVLEESQQLFSAKYLPYLPTEEELKKELKRERNLIEIEKGLQD